METNYTFEEATGCTAFSFTVNDKQISELPEQEYNEMLDYLFVKIKEGINDQTILFEDVVKLFQPDDWKYDSEPCSSCGDTISETTWKI